jgi:hypothetical protein
MNHSPSILRHTARYLPISTTGPSGVLKTNRFARSVGRLPQRDHARGPDHLPERQHVLEAAARLRTREPNGMGGEPLPGRLRGGPLCREDPLILRRPRLLGDPDLIAAGRRVGR